LEVTVRSLKTKAFARRARQEGISDEQLLGAVERAARGLIDAELGGGLIKQRIARRGQGRSGGYRTIIAWRAKNRSIFVYAFAKSMRDNISDAELADLKDLAALYLGYSSKEIDRAVAAGELFEVNLS
jgi:hypothetical protein